MIIRNGILVNPTDGKTQSGDILVESGIIKTVAWGSSLPTQEGIPEIDAKQLYVAPGLVDLHTHLREPGGEYKETIATGTRAAAAGGFTSIACMANTQPVNDSAFITEFIRMKAQKEGVVRVYPIGALTVGLKGENLAEIGSLVEAGVIGLSDDGCPVMDSYLMRKAMDYSKQFRTVVISHAEDLHLKGKGQINEGRQSTFLGLRGTPSASEEIMVARDIALAELTGAKLHIAHVSTEGAVRLIKEAKKRGVLISAEVTPHHLFLTEENVAHYDTNFKVSPPLRTNRDREALMEGLKEGVIDAIATDHAPHSVLEKETEFEEAAFGVIGLETALSVSLQLVEKGVLTLPELLFKMSTAPAKILAIAGGELKAGQPADLTIFDPHAEVIIDKEQFFSKSRNTPFHGWRLRGKIIYTMVGGKIVYPFM